MDAYLAALALSHEAERVTFDKGLQQFKNTGLRLVLLTP